MKFQTLPKAKDFRPHLSEHVPSTFSWMVLLLLGSVSVLSGVLVMDVLLQIVWQDTPIFIL